MDLLDAIRQDPLFREYPATAPIIVDECEDKGLCVEFSDQVDRKDILIIDVDRYYRQHLLGKELPKSVDCLIIQRCLPNAYKVILVELKGHRNSSSISKEDIEEKFEVALFDLIGDRLRHLFFENEYKLTFRLILGAGDPLSPRTKSYGLDWLLGLRIFTFAGRRLGIDGMPRNPVITPC